MYMCESWTCDRHHGKLHVRHLRATLCIERQAEVTPTEVMGRRPPTGIDGCVLIASGSQRAGRALRTGDTETPWCSLASCKRAATSEAARRNASRIHGSDTDTASRGPSAAERSGWRAVVDGGVTQFKVTLRLDREAQRPAS